MEVKEIKERDEHYLNENFLTYEDLNHRSKLINPSIIKDVVSLYQL